MYQITRNSVFRSCNKDFFKKAPKIDQPLLLMISVGLNVNVKKAGRQMLATKNSIISHKNRVERISFCRTKLNPNR